MKELGYTMMLMVTYRTLTTIGTLTTMAMEKKALLSGEWGQKVLMSLYPEVVCNHYAYMMSSTIPMQGEYIQSPWRRLG